MTLGRAEYESKAVELSQLYAVDVDCAARQLSQHRHFIFVADEAYPLVSAHAVKAGLSGNDMCNPRSHSQNIQQIKRSLERVGFRHISKTTDPEFEVVWNLYLELCDMLGVNPSGGDIKTPQDRSFFVHSEVALLSRRVDEDALNANKRQASNFQGKVIASLADNSDARRRRLAKASQKAERFLRVVEAFHRNPDVVAERLFIADGYCESCNSPAPFIRAKDGTAFLEVHHVTTLADGGEDSVKNTRALCPNCHRKAHFG